MSTPSHAPADLTAVALAVAARGWPVFPLAPGTKRPALHGADRCPATGACAGGHAGWEQRATTDSDRIRRAWAAGAFNIGLATGPAGLLVIDLDRPDPAEPGDNVVPERWAVRGITDGAGVLAHLAAGAGKEFP